MVNKYIFVYNSKMEILSIKKSAFSYLSKPIALEITLYTLRSDIGV